MGKKVLILLVAAGLADAVLGGRAGGLEVFRIGGEGEPGPDQPGVNFHQLQWSEFKEKEGFDEEAFAAGILRPFFLHPDENIALTSLARGGGLFVNVDQFSSYTVSDASKKALDADPATFYEWIASTIEDKFSVQAQVQTHRITLNLGGLFPINRVRVFPPPRSGDYPDKLDIATHTEFVNSRQKDLSGELVARVPENVQDTIDVRFPSLLARSVGLLLYRITRRSIKVAEVEVFGEGYINQAYYVSPFVDLGEPAIWGDIRWRGRQDPDARVWIQTRAGKDLDPNVYWRFTGRGDEASRFDEKGRLLDAAAYAQLKPGEAAQITYDMENWSFWSSPYGFADSSGTSILSPGPNSVFQLRVDFLPTIHDGGEIEFIEFAATKPPLAEEVVGEIYPPEVVLGETTQFTYAIRPTIRSQHSGFDRVEISTPFGLAGVDSVKIGGVPVEVQAYIERPDSTLFAVQLPGHRSAEDSGELVEVVFRAPVLRYNTAFDGWVRDTERPLDFGQRINPGNAALELVSDVLAVRTSFSERLLTDLRVAPRIITPNGDGVNEEVNFSFNLLQLTNAVPLRVEVFDLSGRRLWVKEGLQQSGRFNISWDGRDHLRELVPPGVYLYRIDVEAEKGEDQESGTIAVIY